MVQEAGASSVRPPGPPTGSSFLPRTPHPLPQWLRPELVGTPECPAAPTMPKEPGVHGDPRSSILLCCFFCLGPSTGVEHQHPAGPRRTRAPTRRRRTWSRDLCPRGWDPGPGHRRDRRPHSSDSRGRGCALSDTPSPPKPFQFNRARSAKACPTWAHGLKAPGLGIWFPLWVGEVPGSDPE